MKSRKDLEQAINKRQGQIPRTLEGIHSRI